MTDYLIKRKKTRNQSIVPLYRTGVLGKVAELRLFYGGMTLDCSVQERRHAHTEFFKLLIVGVILFVRIAELVYHNV